MALDQASGGPALSHREPGGAAAGGGSAPGPDGERRSVGRILRGALPWAGGTLLLAAIAVLVLIPAGTLLYATFRSKSPVYPNATWTLENWRALARSDFLDALLASLALATVVAVLATFLGMLLAWLLRRTDVRLRRTYEFTLFLPFLLSPFVIASGWIAAFSPRTGFLNYWVLRPILHTGFNIYSWTGIVVVMVVYLVPVAYIFGASSLSSLDGALEEASRAAGASHWRTLRHVTLPMILPAIGSSILLLFVSAIEMFSVPALLGRPFGLDNNLSVLIYKQVSAFPARWTGAAASGMALVLIVSVGIWANRRILRRSHRYTSITGKPTVAQRIKLGRWRTAVSVGVGLYVAITVVVPIGSILFGSIIRNNDLSDFGWSKFTFANYGVLVRDNTSTAIENTLLLSFISPVVIMLVSGASAVLVHKSRSRTVKGSLDFANTIPIAFPGVVFGVALLWVYFPVTWAPVYGTILILFAAYIGKHLAESYRNISGTLVQSAPELEEASRIAGARPAQTTFWVTLPLLRPTLTYTYILLFILSAKEVTAAVILGATSGVQALAPLMWSELTAGSLQQAYVLSALQLVLVSIVLVAARALLGVSLSADSSAVRRTEGR